MPFPWQSGSRAALAVALTLALVLPDEAPADLTPEARCQMAKLSATGRRVRDTLDCHARAVSLGEAVDPPCLTHANAAFSRVFHRAEVPGSCRAVGDAPAVAQELDAFVGGILGALQPRPDGDRCAGAKLAAVGEEAGDLLRAEAKFRRRPDVARLARQRARASRAFLESFAAAEARGSCIVEDDAPLIGGKVDALLAGILCGDSVRELGEECDGTDDAICPANCRADCTCAGTVRFGCLADTGPLVVLQGTHADDYHDDGLPSGTRIDARAAVFLGSPTNRYPINVGGGVDLCLAGGTVLGQYDRHLGWDTMHDMNNAGVAFDSPAFTVDGVRVDNVTDGLRPGGEAFEIRSVWLSYVRDDCVENDHLRGGLIEDSLFDGCYVGISERPGTGNVTDDGRDALLTIRRSLIRLEAMPGPRNGAPGDRGLGRFFKWDERASQLALHDNVFLAEQVGQDGARAMGIPDTLVSCANNVMVWLGGGDYPTTLPACFTVTNDRSVWDAAVQAWKDRHPHVGPP